MPTEPPQGDRPEGPTRRGPARPGPVSTRQKLIAAGLGALVLALAVALALASRDDGGGATTTTTEPSELQVVSLGEWREQVESGCRRWNREFDHLPDARPGTAEEAIEHTEDVEALAVGLAGVLVDAGLPDEERDAAEELAERSREMADAAGELAASAGAADGDGVDRATERIEQLGDRIDELAAELDVPACGGY